MLGIGVNINKKTRKIDRWTPLESNDFSVEITSVGNEKKPLEKKGMQKPCECTVVFHMRVAGNKSKIK